MTKKPFFREFDGWWYAQIRVGTKRVQQKLIKGRECEKEAYKLFFKLMSGDQPAPMPEPSQVTVQFLCDQFLKAASPYADPEHERPSVRRKRERETGVPQPPQELKEHATCDERTFWWYHDYLQSFCRPYGKKKALEVIPLNVSQWLDANPGWKASRRCAVTSVKRAYNWANEVGLLTSNPLKTMKKPASVRRERIVTQAEWDELFAAIRDQEFKDFVTALRESGARPGEVRKVTAAQIDLELRVWVLPKHKASKRTNRPRVIYLTDAMVELCKRLIARWPEGPIFRGPAWKGCKPFTRNAVRCRFKRLRAKLPQLKGVISYTLRHSYASDALENGVPLATVAELMGHTNTKMLTEFYNHLSQKREHLSKAVEQARKKPDGPIAG